MIIEDRIIKNKIGINKRYYLVSCDHPNHFGERTRLISHKRAKLKIDIDICLNCSIKYIKNTKKKDVNDYLNLAKIANFKFLGPLPSSTMGKTFWQCKNNHTCETTYQLIQAGHYCSKCKRCFPKSLKDYFDLAESRGITFLPPIPKNSEEKALWKCGCGKLFFRSYSQTVKVKPRCLDCDRKSRSGSNHYLFNPNISEDDRNENRFDSLGYQTFRKEIRILYNYSCFYCSSHRYPEIHHILNWGEYPKLRFDRENVIILCKYHHKEFHKKYNCINNNKNQLETFLNYRLEYNYNLLKYEHKI